MQDSDLQQLEVLLRELKIKEANVGVAESVDSAARSALDLAKKAADDAAEALSSAKSEAVKAAADMRTFMNDASK